VPADFTPLGAREEVDISVKETTMSVQALREFVTRSMTSAAGLAALGAALDAKASGASLDPALDARIKELLATFGVADALAGVSAQEAKPLVTEIRLMAAIDSKLLNAQTRTTTWNYTDAAVLEGAGAMSAGFVGPLAQVLLPGLEGAMDRLNAPGATFLDIGVGVGALAMAVAKRWPTVQVVGIDPWQPSLALARENVAQAGLTNRITLREQRAEDLKDERAFDLAWIPALFMPRRAVKPACERILEALRPGGWMLFNAVQPGVDPQTDAMWWLRMTMFGDSAMPSAEAETLLREIGFSEVQTLASPAGSFMRIVAARRKSA
jgi:SAM-dependent methyltransferase